MTYCEIAQKDCEYLGFLERARDHLLIDRATEERLDEEFSSIATEVVEDWQGSPKVPDWQCSSASCGIVKRVIGKAISDDARDIFAGILEERHNR